MSRIVYCLFFKKKADGLNKLCYPGSLGQYIYNNISKKAWEQWQNKQTILINENKLNMLKVLDRAFLEKEMKLFLFGAEHYLNKK
ncbi:oxidative damage protection protein [Candidatus Blochmannia ocreatus (nom. nud.)]|uniref:Probable Fe(2+)-trafficking protein n=1 Tax=Candidatus Blochmannia ocreatus (nom. nud.) TaxID=251538 RepID=A0ABY4SV69_9ENTR|nr:oxidative damage protection protein [Candidatus Blochmannia ocreatus]URJ25314.1 oxidative damage protection protein [Candidatus Blochmannia ocreatus]